MNIQTATQICLKKYIDINGRASRSEYWWFVLVVWALRILAFFMHPVVLTLVVLFTTLPLISVMVRRLHDSNTSGWWGLLLLIPIINFIIVYLMIIKGTDGPNLYGNPSS